MKNSSNFTGPKPFKKHEADYWVVTSCTPQYIPGLIALRNSMEMFFPEGSLACFMYNQDKELDLPERVHYIHNAPMLGPIVASGGKFRDGLLLGPDMYARLLIPKYFEGKVFYVDADCAILQSLKEAWELDLGGYPTACVLREDIGWVGGNVEDKMASGTFLCDTEEWERLGMVEKCFQTMKDYSEGKIKRKFNVNVESALAYSHNEEFLPLNRKYQNLAYYGLLSQEDSIIHWGGPKPWYISGDKREMEYVCYKDLWDCLYKNDKEKVNELLSKLPKTLGKKINPRQRTEQRTKQRGKRIQ